MGRPAKDRSFANMLHIAIREAVRAAETGELLRDADGKPIMRLRAVADALVLKAMSGDVAAIKEVADRLDGKVPQGLIGGDDDDPPIVAELRRVIVRPNA